MDRAILRQIKTKKTEHEIQRTPLNNRQFFKDRYSEISLYK